MNDTKITRINSGIKDLLPYAYGRVDQNGVAMTGTNNWTITSDSPGVYYLEFTEVDAGDLILQATPVAGLEILFDIGIELIISYVNENTIVVKTTAFCNYKIRYFLLPHYYLCPYQKVFCRRSLVFFQIEARK